MGGIRHYPDAIPIRPLCVYYFRVLQDLFGCKGTKNDNKTIISLIARNDHNKYDT